MSDDILKPNSDNALANQAEREIRKPEAKVRKRRGFGEFMSSLFKGNRDGFLYHVLYGIIAPRTVDAVDDILKDGIDRMLHPTDTRYGSDYRREKERRYDQVSYRSYDSMFESNSNSRRYEPETRYDRTPDPRTIEFNDRYEALKVLDDMKDAIYEDRFCTIQQFYEFARRHAGVNITPNWTDERYGWSDLGGVRPEMTYNGKYTLRLPPTERM